MKYIVTGATGFLGKVVVDELEHQGHEVVTLGRNGNMKADLSQDISPINENVDALVHVAGKAHVYPKTEAEKAEFFDVNAAGTQRLLSALEGNKGLKLVVFISTVNVYGKHIGTGFHEDTPLEANNPYGLSKIQAESMVSDFCNERSIAYANLRLPLIIGNNPKGNLQKIGEAILKRRYVRIWPNRASKSMVLARDVAKLIASDTILHAKGCYNLTDGLDPEFGMVEKAIMRNKRFDVNLLPTIPLFTIRIFVAIAGKLPGKFKQLAFTFNKMTRPLCFDSSKAVKELGWSPNSCIEFLEKDFALNDE